MPSFGGRHKNPTSTVSRRVIVSPRCAKRDRLWAFGYADLAHLLGLTEETVRNLVCGNALDPGDLEAVCQAWLRQKMGARLAVDVGELPPEDVPRVFRALRRAWTQATQPPTPPPPSPTCDNGCCSHPPCKNHPG